MRLLLASSSPRRAELLRTLGVDFTVVPSDAAESENTDLTAREICLLNAYRKARVVAKRFPDEMVLGADTLVHRENVVYAKPRDREEAGRFLRELAGGEHHVVTGVCLLRWRGHHERLFAESTAVVFRPLTDVQITAYHERINPLDKAGGYAIQEHGSEIVQAILGSYTNVVGLPLERLREELATFPG